MVNEQPRDTLCKLVEISAPAIRSGGARGTHPHRGGVPTTWKGCIGMATGVDRIEIARLLRQGMKYADVARECGCSYRTVSSVAEEIGIARKQASHKEALPWTVIKDHKLSMPAQRLRDLSRLAQGLHVDAHRKIGAIRWAQQLVDQGLDVSYNPDAGPSTFCPDGGFYTIPAKGDPADTHVGKWLSKATGMPVRRSTRG